MSIDIEFAPSEKKPLTDGAYAIYRIKFSNFPGPLSNTPDIGYMTVYGPYAMPLLMFAVRKHESSEWWSGSDKPLLLKELPRVIADSPIDWEMVCINGKDSVVIGTNRGAYYEHSLYATTAKSRETDPRTSHEAAASIRLSELQDTVLQALKIIPGGATSLELADALCMSPWSVSPRIKPLVKKGLVRDSGRTRMGVSGRASIVWEAV